jgi:hypothetical protein
MFSLKKFWRYCCRQWRINQVQEALNHLVEKHLTDKHFANRHLGQQSFGRQNIW